MNDQGFSRREFLRALALGGAVVAGELWIPGQRVISIPKPEWTWIKGEPGFWLGVDFAKDIDEVTGIAGANFQWPASFIASRDAINQLRSRMLDRLPTLIIGPTPDEAVVWDGETLTIKGELDEQVLQGQADSELLPARPGVQS